MSHYTVLVVTEKYPTVDVLEEALLPFHEFECTGLDNQYVVDFDITAECRESWENYKDGESFEAYVEEDYPEGKYNRYERNEKEEIVSVFRRTNPNHKWDWYQVAGRWGGVLSGVDRCQKSSFDAELFRANRADKAGKAYDKVHECIGNDFETFKTWQTILEATPESINKARLAYNSQPAVVKLRANSRDLSWETLDDYVCTRDEYCNNAYNDGMTFAILYEGKWIARGDMGWLACVYNEVENFGETYWKVISTIPDNYYLTVVDCHT